MAFEIRYYNANSEQRRYRIRHHEYPCFLVHPVDESMKTWYSALCYQKSISTKAFSQKLTSFRKHSYTLLQHKGNEFCHNLYFLTTILTIRFRRPLIFQTMNSVRSKSLNLKYQRCITLDCKDRGTRKFEFVAKFHFCSIFFCLFSGKGRLD